MAQADEGENRATQRFAASMQMSNFSKDLLQRLVSGEHCARKLEDPSEDAEEEIELSLGLSMNGRFGVDPRAKSLALKRSSSIADFTSTNPVKEEEDTASPVRTERLTPLARTCSLPAEREEEWRKRKKLQTLRRMEAKRKRLEKQRNSKAARDRSQASLEEKSEEDKPVNDDGMVQQEQCVKVAVEFSRMGMFSRAASGLELNGDGGSGARSGLDGLPPQPPSQRSIGSQGSGSSGISESDSPAGQGILGFFHLSAFLCSFFFFLPVLLFTCYSKE